MAAPPKSEERVIAPVEIGGTDARTSRDVSKQHILTVNVEDYFQVASFQRLIEQDQWYRFETRLARNIDATLELLDRFDTQATFFTLGWIAERSPELIARISEAGHEMASCGFYHHRASDLSPEEFRADVIRARDAIQRATSKPVVGYRVADDWLTSEDLWTLDIWADEGCQYDSSIMPARSPRTKQRRRWRDLDGN
ncbi:MAG: hypothetical protein CMJ78_16070 [Planctomycetaceae bacterium]|nr:hypothetical protein [Planctomycetaceae bacterium]